MCWSSQSCFWVDINVCWAMECVDILRITISKWACTVKTTRCSDGYLRLYKWSELSHIYIISGFAFAIGISTIYHFSKIKWKLVVLNYALSNVNNLDQRYLHKWSQYFYFNLISRHFCTILLSWSGGGLLLNLMRVHETENIDLVSFRSTALSPSCGSFLENIRREYRK